MLHSHWVSPDSPMDSGMGWPAGTEEGEALATCAEKGSVDPGVCTGSRHLQLRGWHISGRAGLSLPFPQSSKSTSPEVPAHCPVSPGGFKG